MASLTRIVSPPLRPVLPRPRPLRAWVLRPRPLLPHVGPRRLLSAPLRRESPVSTVPPEAARRVVERAEPRVRVVPARADPGARFDRVASRAAPRTTTEEAPPVKTPVARRAAEAAAPPPAAPAPRLRTRPIVEAGPQQPTPQVAPPEVGEPRALRPAPPRPSAPAAVRTAPQLRPTVVPPSPVANDAPLRPAAPRTVAVPTAETHASRPAPAPAVGAREAAPPRATPVQNERPRAEVRPAPAPAAPVLAPPPPPAPLPRERVVQLREVVHERPQRAAPAVQVRPAPAQRPAAAVPTASAPASTRAPVTIEIGRVEIRTAQPRAAAPLLVHATPPRPHAIDPGLGFAGGRW